MLRRCRAAVQDEASLREDAYPDPGAPSPPEEESQLGSGHVEPKQPGDRRPHGEAELGTGAEADVGGDVGRQRGEGVRPQHGLGVRRVVED